MDGCHDRIIPIKYREWCVGSSSRTKEQICGIFQVDIPDKTCSTEKYWKT